MESNLDENKDLCWQRLGKKRKAEPKLWKRNVIKTARLKGVEFVNQKGNTVPQKSTGLPCSCKRTNCFEMISEEDQLEVLNYFYSLKTKDEQDLFLQSLIDAYKIKQRRPRKEDSKTNCAAFKYHVMVGSTRMQVCFKAFLSLHAVTKKRIERLRGLKMVGTTPIDQRGHHVKKALSEETKLIMSGIKRKSYKKITLIKKNK